MITCCEKTDVLALFSMCCLVHQMQCANVFLKDVQDNNVNSKIFAIILFSRIALKDICDFKNSQLRHDLPASVNN